VFFLLCVLFVLVFNFFQAGNSECLCMFMQNLRTIFDAMDNDTFVSILKKAVSFYPVEFFMHSFLFFSFFCNDCSSLFL
jgi:hypothetical protein